ncbi:SufD family Fe-S cluster assembly protein [Pediococcus acidilactici]|uniref:SufD family Fe-S cluster assembly protein n=1 Tax=Pediococcus acidilactici TaxID=1254 RepID=UPI003CFB06A8
MEWTVWFDLGVHSRLTTKLTLDLAGEVHQSNCLIGGTLADESNLTLITDTQSHQATRSLLLGDFVNARDANLDWSLWPQTKGQLLGDLNVTLAGTGSRATLNLARYGYQDDWVGIRGQIKHLGQHTFSRINMRGVLYENSGSTLRALAKLIMGPMMRTRTRKVG